jgi:hypothetical protein
MKVRKVVERDLSATQGDVRVAGLVNAAVAANIGEPEGSVTRVSTRRRVVQRSGRAATTTVESTTTQEDHR